ncbi:hypothetical protein GCM10023149_27550 [Mucilaginibacter gynuensis]|uniref:DUF4270 domain-containing protein n=1 Tax=Mucilaginibacter gynuensis TaxID=1302236 RepID=A0ABP8GJS6_9SPHI
MKSFRLDLLTLLISLFILNGCKNPDNIGLGVDESNQLSGTLVTDTTVTVNTLREDSVITSGLVRTPLSNFNDPILGTTEANMITDLNLPSFVAYTRPTGTIVIDSAILTIRYSDGFYGDSLTSAYKANVYKLTERPLGITYYSAKHWSYNPNQLLGTKAFTSRTHDSLKVFDIVKGATDTIKKVAPQLRIPMDTQFFKDNFFESPDAISSNTAFRNLVRGLYITLDKSQSTGPGGTFMFKLDDSASVDLYVKVTNGSTIDTSVISLPISGHAAEIRHTYSTEVETALANTTTSNTVGYIQGGSGLKTKVTFPGLKNLPVKDIIINRAELVVTPVPGTQTTYKPLPRLILYKHDIANQPVLLEDASRASAIYYNLFGGFYGLPTANEYHFLVTTYVQNLLSGKTKDYGTYLIAGADTYTTVETTTADILGTAQSGARTIIAGKNSAFRVKLNIIYTKVK